MSDAMRKRLLQECEKANHKMADRIAQLEAEVAVERRSNYADQAVAAEARLAELETILFGSTQGSWATKIAAAKEIRSAANRTPLVIQDWAEAQDRIAELEHTNQVLRRELRAAEKAEEEPDLGTRHWD